MPDPALAGLSTVDNPAHDTLLIALDTAVQLWMIELARLPDDIRDHDRQIWAHRSADVIAAQGDILQYGTRARSQRADVAKAFTALAQGLAALAYQPGGVTAFGRHWCTDHRACETAAAAAEAMTP